jgi:hypothetical protein
MYRQHSHLTYTARHGKGLANHLNQPQRDAGNSAGRDWQADAIASYQAAAERERPLATALAARVYTLAGRVVQPESIFVDDEASQAVAVVDGVTFRMRQGQVAILRRCAECGLGHIESQPLGTREELGYALSGWEPRHPGCQPEDSINWLESDL